MADMFLVQHAFKALPAGGSVSLATRSVQGASTAYSITPGASAAPAYLKTVSVHCRRCSIHPSLHSACVAMSSELQVQRHMPALLKQVVARR